MNQSDRERQKKATDDLAPMLTEEFLRLFPAAERFYERVLIPVLEKREGKWFVSTYEKLKRLEDQIKGLRAEELFDNETFVTSLMKASQSAIRNHQEEKLEALRNAVLNSALPNAPEEDKQAIFLGLIDDFTPSHLKLLSMYKKVHDENPKDYREKEDLIEECIRKTFPDLPHDASTYSLLLADLATRELVLRDAMGTQSDNWEQHFLAGITDIGLEFLYFISSPLEDDKK